MATQSSDGEVPNVCFAPLIHHHHTLQGRCRESDGERLTGEISLKRRAVDVWSVHVKPLHRALTKPARTVVEHMWS